MRVEQNDLLAKVALDDALGTNLALPYVGLVVLDGDELCGALAFNNYEKHVSVDMTCIVLNPWTLGALRDIAYYCFVTLRVKRVTAKTHVENHRAINRLLALGFRFEARIEDGLPQGDALLFGLTAKRQKILRRIQASTERPQPAGGSGSANAIEPSDRELSNTA